MTHASALTQFYHTRDPIENLRVRVVARKVGSLGSNAVAVDSPAAVPVGSTWTHCFRWQEKALGVKAGVGAGRMLKKEKLANHMEKANVDEPSSSSTLHENGSDSDLGDDRARRHHGVTLCSYVDVDNYVPRGIHRGTPVASVAPPLHLAAAAADYHLSHTRASATSSVTSGMSAMTTWMSNRDRVTLRVHREETFRQMHIVLRLEENDEELVLTTLRYYPHTGLLCMTPGFSALVDVESDPLASEKGPQLATYRMSSSAAGAHFEYALDNPNDLVAVVSTDDQRMLLELEREDERDAISKAEEWGNKHGDVESGSAQVPNASSQSGGEEVEREQALVLMEIVTLHNAPVTNPVRVAYEFQTSPVHNAADTTKRSDAWEFSRMHRSCGSSRLSRPLVREAGGTFTAFGDHAHFHLSRSEQLSSNDGDEARALPSSTILFTVTASDSWAREHLVGHAELPVPQSVGFYDMELRLWKPAQSPEEEMEDYFLGHHSNATEAMSGAGASECKFSNQTAVLSRFGTASLSTEVRLRVRLHVVVVRPALVQRAGQPAPPQVSAAARDGVVKRSVHEILQSVKTEKRSSGLSEAQLQSTLRSLSMSGAGSAVNAILARLQSSKNSGTSPSAG